jgi:hypothetical protein
MNIFAIFFSEVAVRVGEHQRPESIWVTLELDNGLFKHLAWLEQIARAHGSIDIFTLVVHYVQWQPRVEVSVTKQMLENAVVLSHIFDVLRTSFLQPLFPHVIKGHFHCYIMKDS